MYRLGRKNSRFSVTSSSLWFFKSTKAQCYAGSQWTKNGKLDQYNKCMYDLGFLKKAKINTIRNFSSPPPLSTCNVGRSFQTKFQKMLILAISKTFRIYFFGIWDHSAAITTVLLLLLSPSPSALKSISTTYVCIKFAHL